MINSFRLRKFFLSAKMRFLKNVWFGLFRPKNTQPRKKSPNHTFFRTSQFTQTEKKITQPKRIYSANGNPFIPMIYRFYAPPSPIFDKDFKLDVLIIVYRT